MARPGDDSVERFLHYLRGQAANARTGFVATGDDVRLFREVANSDVPLDQHLCGLLGMSEGSTIGRAAHLLLTDPSRFTELPEIHVRPDEQPEA
jgi:hypothetical protein